MAVKVRVSRFDPLVDQTPYFETFDVPVTDKEAWTVSNILDYIQEHLDSSLSYYRHSACNRGICMRCIAKVNGRARLLCKHVVSDESDIVLEPIEGREVTKDLV
ncbi:2Fe-2S iron-sulfur cluster-binding protein [Thermodesulfobacteriota bacterium]